ncbi:MAG: type II toxin-antitoxin system RelB/DinJ family antitoxin [Rickettsiales bacterium]
MSNDLIQIRLPHEMRLQAEAVLSGIGLKTPEAVRVFLQQCINANGLPFQPLAQTPNAETLAAFNEIETGKTTKTDLNALRRRAKPDAAH